VSDDDDWTGEPPEGRHTRADSNPDFWRNQWQPVAIAGTVVLVLLVILLLVLLS
jgi:hypothetical protein